MSGQKVIQKQSFLVSDKLPEEITQKKQFQKPSLNCGRPSDRLSEHQLKQAIAIVSWDMMKMGKIRKWECRQHGRTAITYRFQVGDGIHVWCEICGQTSHFQDYHFDGREDTEEE